ncbi:MAG: Bax inhibitor-1/YccA family protein [Planctomycetaceae bacterium]|nr:MAG: Bax inhibitor-1/YccA family protein [Planctomycetaceae bacterium]
MRTANPALNGNVFDVPNTGSSSMTIIGTVNKTAILLAIAVTAAIWSWQKYANVTEFSELLPLFIISLLGSIIACIITIFVKRISSITAPVYAGFEGVLLGIISASFNARYPGIVFNAVILTFGTLASLLVAYRTGLIKVTENFKLGIIAATGGICLVYMLSIVLGIFGVHVPMIHGSGLVGLLFSGFVVVIAALNLVLDFDFIENAAANNAPKYMEWYAAFGLMVTLVWLYLEILRLLAKLNSRR